MTLEEFVQHFAEQFDETDVNLIKADTKFKELEEWSSLISLSVIAMVDEEYEVALICDDIRNSSTIEDLFIVVRAKK